MSPFLKSITAEFQTEKDLFDSYWFMVCPWAMSFFQKLCPAPFPPVTPLETPYPSVNPNLFSGLGPLLRGVPLLPSRALLPPGQALHHPGNPPRFRVPILCMPPPSPFQRPSTIWEPPPSLQFPPPSQGPLHPPGPASLWAPSTLWDPLCPPGTPPRATSAHVGPAGGGEKGDRAGVPPGVEERGIHLVFPCPGP